MNILAFVLILSIGLSLIAGSFLGINLYKQKKINMNLIVNILFGAMVTLISVKLIPKILIVSVEYLGRLRGFLVCSVLTFLGFIIIKQIDLFIPHHEESDDKHEHNCYHYYLKHVGIILIVSILIYEFIQGIDIFNNVVENYDLGLLLCISYAIWNFLIGIIISYKLINFLDKNKVLIINSLLVLTIFLGGIVAFLFNFNSEILIVLILSVSLGMMIYMIFCELLDQIIKIEEKKDIKIGIILGILLTTISIIIG